jgi:hypothetical protein
MVGNVVGAEPSQEAQFGERGLQVRVEAGQGGDFLAIA